MRIASLKRANSDISLEMREITGALNAAKACYIEYKALYEKNRSLLSYYEKQLEGKKINVLNYDELDFLRQGLEKAFPGKRKAIYQINNSIFEITRKLFNPSYDLLDAHIKYREKWKEIEDHIRSSIQNSYYNMIFEGREMSQDWIGFPTRYTQDSGVYDWQNEQWVDGDNDYDEEQEDPLHVGLTVNFITQVIPYEGYMLDEDLWLTVAKKDENLCIGCLERRLGRRLTPNDFQNIPYNFGFEGEVEQIPKSKRLRERLGV